MFDLGLQVLLGQMFTIEPEAKRAECSQRVHVGLDKVVRYGLRMIFRVLVASAVLRFQVVVLLSFQYFAQAIPTLPSGTVWLST